MLDCNLLVLMYNTPQERKVTMEGQGLAQKQDIVVPENIPTSPMEGIFFEDPLPPFLPLWKFQ